MDKPSKDPLKKEWVLVYKNKYILQVSSKGNILKRIENCPGDYQSDYKCKHITECKGYINTTQIRIRNTK